MADNTQPTPATLNVTAQDVNPGLTLNAVNPGLTPQAVNPGLTPQAVNPGLTPQAVNPGLVNPGVATGTTVTGTIDFGAEQEIYPIQLTAGETYIFEVTAGTLRDPELTLRDASGNRLAYNDDIDDYPSYAGPRSNWESYIEFTAPSSGTYNLVVDSYREGTGTFTLSARVDAVADDTGTIDRVAPDAWQPGTINSGADQDVYAIQLTGGQRYTFDVFGNTRSDPGVPYTLTDPTLTLRDASGNQLAYNDDVDDYSWYAGPRPNWDSFIDFTAPSTGTYYLDVGGLGDNTGTYLLVT